jgi:hypothetical protein
MEGVHGKFIQSYTVVIN